MIHSGPHFERDRVPTVHTEQASTLPFNSMWASNSHQNAGKYQFIINISSESIAYSSFYLSSFAQTPFTWDRALLENQSIVFV